MTTALLSVKNLSVVVQDGDHEKSILNQVSFDVHPKSIVALVGGSGSGKTTTAYSVIRLLDSALKITSGQIVFEGQDILTLSQRQLRGHRGKSFGMIFQEPLAALNPVFTIAYQIDEVLKYHTELNKVERSKKVLSLIERVGLPNPEQVIKKYPHELSGGMRQRAMIAQAIAAEPRLLIADEPTSSLDVTLQARIMALFRDLVDDMGVSILLISHDLSMVGHIADQVVVLSKGCKVESGDAKTVLEQPQHEYTAQLIKAAS